MFSTTHYYFQGHEHPLTLLVFTRMGRVRTRICDVCQERMANFSTHPGYLGCLECDFDVCLQCFHLAEGTSEQPMSLPCHIPPSGLDEDVSDEDDEVREDDFEEVPRGASEEVPRDGECPPEFDEDRRT